VVSSDGVVLRANPAFASLLQMPVADIPGTKIVDLTYPADRATTENTVTNLASRQGGHARIQTRYVRRDGTAVTADTSIVAVGEADGPGQLLFTVSDLSASPDLLGQLQVASERYKRLFDANIIGVAVATEKGVIEANDEMLRVAGCTRGEFEANGLDWMAITPPEHLVKDFAALEEMTERGACVPFEKEFLHRDGTRVPLLVGGAQLENTPPTWIAFALDLSERKRAERDRDRLLEEAWTARDAADAALHSRDSLLARVSHDLRTPLAANSGYATMMRDGIPIPLPAVHQETVRRMIANQHRLLELMDGLLEFAASSSGRTAFDLKLIDVDALLAEIEPGVNPQLEEARLTYACRPCEQPLTVRADRRRAAQVLLNLVSNAIKFTPPGGHIEVGAEAADDSVIISVSDTGVGISEEDLPTVFEPFVQAHTSPQDASRISNPKGFGLGLAISRELARGMDGSLTVTSELGKGTTFSLRLPRGNTAET
jgi:PAS domain S-box-containing protein